MIIIIATVVCLSLVASLEVYRDPSDINLALIMNKCRNKTALTPYSTQSVINSAIWITQRLNYLELASPLNFGLEVWKTCTQKENFDAIFSLYNASDQNYLLGVISEEPFKDKVSELSTLLEIERKVIPKVYKYIVKSAVEFLSMMNWFENVTVIVNSERILSQFYTFSARKYICVNNYFMWRKQQHCINETSDTVVFFGDKEDIDSYMTENGQNTSYNNLLLVPIDGSVPKGLPENTYVLIPNHNPLTKYYKKSTQAVLTPQLFDIANPMLNFAQSIGDFIRDDCNETIYKLNCIRNKFDGVFPKTIHLPLDIMNILKIQPLEEHLVYNIYLAHNTSDSELLKKNNFVHPYMKIFTYNILVDKWLVQNASVILDNLEEHNSSTEFCKESIEYCSQYCKNYQLELNEFAFGKTVFSEIVIRTDSWVYAFLSLSVLGILFCIAILCFILISICRRDMLEGNPALTISLLIAVMLMFLSVLPFCLNVSSAIARDTVCLLKSTALTLTYAMAYSLLLSRCILLASASKEIGFMSHIAGSVQSFLCLFIFGVQAALSLQVFGKCAEFFKGYSFIFLMSYDIMLLLLLLCLCPLIYKCERNYREGKYFVIAICLTTIVWCIWLPAYTCLRHDWKEPILCFGIVSTASIFLGSIFIPRTYLMTIAAARDRITSRLPSLATATSAIDIYRANTQPVYDCVNVAAINAVNVARAGVVGTQFQHPDLYSCPALPDDDDIDFRCDSPLSTDKVTRF